MKIIKLLSNNAVIFTGDDLSLDATGAHGDGWTAAMFTTANAALETINEALPVGYIGNAWAYNGGWFVLPGQQAMVDAEISAIYQASVPRQVTRRQARQALLLRGKLALVQPAIDAIPDATQRGLMQIEWDDSLSFDRDRASLIAIGAAIGYDASALDDVFVFASKL